MVDACPRNFERVIDAVVDALRGHLPLWILYLLGVAVGIGFALGAARGLRGVVLKHVKIHWQFAVLFATPS